MAQTGSKMWLGMASKHMEAYRLSTNDADEVRILLEDTGIILLIILYLIDQSTQRGKKICRSKLEYYLLLLDRKYFDKKGAPFFTWDLTNSRIQNFKKFTEFMVKKGLIISNGSAYFELTETGNNLGTLFSELSCISTWLDALIAEWGEKTAAQMKAEVIAAKNDQKYQDALNNMRGLLGL